MLYTLLKIHYKIRMETIKLAYWIIMIFNTYLQLKMATNKKISTVH